MKRTPVLIIMLLIASFLSANPFLGRWDCVEVDNTRLRMTFLQDMKVRVERRQEAGIQEVNYEVCPENPLITINGASFTYLFTDKDHFILYPDMSELITQNAGTETVRSLLLSIFRSHFLFTGRRVR